jgi:GNAT superfamily N-acetyltransferase
MFADAALARRIELAEARNASEAGESIEIAGGYASFAGVGSPLTHAIGLGLNGPITSAEFARLEAFYHSHGSPVNLDLYPHADWSMFDFVAARGYRIVECNNVLIGPAIGGPDARVRIADDREAWSQTVIEGFFPHSGFSEPELDVCRRLVKLDNATAWLATVDGNPAAGAAMNIRGKLALLFADSTLQKYRGHGLHLALIRARLKHAADHGCDLATASTAPGSTSQHNYERAGFRVVYTKLNMQRD